MRHNLCKLCNEPSKETVSISLLTKAKYVQNVQSRRVICLSKSVSLGNRDTLRFVGDLIKTSNRLLRCNYFHLQLIRFARFIYNFQDIPEGESQFHLNQRATRNFSENILKDLDDIFVRLRAIGTRYALWRLDRT